MLVYIWAKSKGNLGVVGATKGVYYVCQFSSVRSKDVTYTHTTTKIESTYLSEDMQKKKKGIRVTGMIIRFIIIIIITMMIASFRPKTSLIIMTFYYYIQSVFLFTRRRSEAWEWASAFSTDIWTWFNPSAPHVAVSRSLRPRIWPCEDRRREVTFFFFLTVVRSEFSVDGWINFRSLSNRWVLILNTVTVPVVVVVGQVKVVW